MILISLLCFLTSCVSVKKLEKLNPKEIDEFSLKKFNGFYENTNLNDSINVALWDKLYELKRKKTDTIDFNEISKIKLNFDNKKTLTITAFNNDKIISEFKIKSKIKNSYLSLKRKLFLIPLPFVFYTQSERKIILGNNNKGELIMKYGYGEFAWILIMAGGYDGINSYKFKKE